MRIGSGSIRLRLLALAALGAVGALALAGGGLIVLFDRYAERRTEHELMNYLSQLAGGVLIDAAGRLDVDDGPPNPRFSIHASGLYWQLEDRGNGSVLRSPSLGQRRLTMPGAIAPNEPARLSNAGLPDGHRGIFLARSVRFGVEPNVRTLDLVVATDRGEMDDLRWGFALDMAPGLVFLAVLFIVGAWFQVGVGLRPLLRVRGHVQAVRAGERSRLQLDVPSEVSPLVEEVNSLLDVREREMERARDRAADLAHGIKTPLTALASDARRLREMGRNDIAHDIEELAGRMRRVVDRELARSRLRGPRAGELGTSVRPILRSIIQILSKTPDGERVTFIDETDDDRVLPAHPDDLTDMLGNILENAARAARSRVWISSPADTTFRGVVVEDDGEGVDERLLADLTKRGTQAANARGSAGIGLSIVADIVSIYGGRLRFTRSSRGGLRVEITLVGNVA